MSGRLSSRLVVSMGLAASMAGLVGSCKKFSLLQKDENSAKSIDAIQNVDSGFRNQIACGKAQQENAMIDTAKAYEASPADARARVYGALPPLFRKVFPVVEQSFVLSDNIEADCGPVFEKVIKEQKLQVSGSSIGREACWTMRDKNGAKVPVVYLKKSSETVHNTMIAMAAYAFFEAIDQQIGVKVRAGTPLPAELAQANETNGVWEWYKAFQEDRHQLAKDFLADLEGQEKSVGLAADKQGIAQTFRARFQIPAGQEVADHDGAQMFFLAELIDTYYCQKKTYDSFVAGPFPKALGTFRRFSAVLQEPFFYVR